MTVYKQSNGRRIEVESEAEPEAVAGANAGGGTEVPQRGPSAQSLVGIRGQSRPKMGVWWRSLTYFDYLTVDLVFNFARFIKGGKIKNEL